MSNTIRIIQLFLAVALIVLTLIQEKGNQGISGAIADTEGGGGPIYRRRGLEKVVFVLTLIILALFVIASLFNLLLEK